MAKKVEKKLKKEMTVERLRKLIEEEGCTSVKEVLTLGDKYRAIYIKMNSFEKELQEEIIDMILDGKSYSEIVEEIGADMNDPIYMHSEKKVIDAGAPVEIILGGEVDGAKLVSDANDDTDNDDSSVTDISMEDIEHLIDGSDNNDEIVEESGDDETVIVTEVINKSKEQSNEETADKVNCEKTKEEPKTEEEKKVSEESKSVTDKVTESADKGFKKMSKMFSFGKKKRDPNEPKTTFDSVLGNLNSQLDDMLKIYEKTSA